MRDSLEPQAGAGTTTTKPTRCQKKGAKSNRKTGKHACGRENSRWILKSRIPRCSALPLLALLKFLCTSVFYCDISSGLIWKLSFVRTIAKSQGVARIAWPYSDDLDLFSVFLWGGARGQDGRVFQGLQNCREKLSKKIFVDQDFLFRIFFFNTTNNVYSFGGHLTLLVGLTIFFYEYLHNSWTGLKVCRLVRRDRTLV